MGSRVRIKLYLLRQIKLGLEYGWSMLDIDILCFKIRIDLTNYEMSFFKFENLFKEKNY